MQSSLYNNSSKYSSSYNLHNNYFNKKEKVNAPKTLVPIHKQQVSFSNQIMEQSFGAHNISKITNIMDDSHFKINSKQIFTQQSSSSKKKNKPSNQLTGSSEKKSRRKRREEDEVVLKEGELLKIVPSLGNTGAKGCQFRDRWCQLTENRFRYYKNKIGAYNQPHKPLLSIPLIEIVQIVQSRVNKQENQFEIIMEKDLSSYVLGNHLLDKLFNSPQKQKADERSVVPGHLMRMPPSNSKNINNSLQKQNSEMDEIKKKYFQINADEQFSRQILQEVDKNHWSKRENDWFNLEEKLIFKNNKNNVSEGDPNVVNEWLMLILKQRSKLQQEEDLYTHSLKKNDISQSSEKLTISLQN